LNCLREKEKKTVYEYEGRNKSRNLQEPIPLTSPGGGAEKGEIHVEEEGPRYYRLRDGEREKKGSMKNYDIEKCGRRVKDPPKEEKRK